MITTINLRGRDIVIYVFERGEKILLLWKGRTSGSVAAAIIKCNSYPQKQEWKWLSELSRRSGSAEKS
jgi:hypothetical protein